MKRLLLLLAVLLPSLLRAQPGLPYHLSADSFKTLYEITRPWKFYPGDDPAMALPDYDDSNWDSIGSSLVRRTDTGKIYQNFNGICWLRLRFSIDSAMITTPLSLALTQSGASEIYLDGRLIKKFGRIAGPDSIEYYDPQYIPVHLVLPRPGEHVLAVRYANYRTQEFFEDDEEFPPGFFMNIGDSFEMLENFANSLLTYTYIFQLLFGIFVAFSLQHFFLYLYYRKSRSHLYFSIFTCSIALIFLMLWLTAISNDVDLQYNSERYGDIVLCTSAFGLSGLINSLFSAKKTRFHIVTALCVIGLTLSIFRSLPFSDEFKFVLMTVVSFEALFVVTRAMIRRVKGARIIGIGILLFAIFLLLILYMVFQSESVQLQGTLGFIIILGMAGAILSVPLSMSVYLAWYNADRNRDLATQLEQVKLLSQKTLEQEQEKKRLLESRQEELEQEVALRTAEVVSQKEKIEKQHEELKTEKQKSDNLLLNILPAEVAEELKEKGSTSARQFDEVSVLFTDFVDFTSAAERLSPQELVTELDTCFKAFDNILSNYGIEKIKTIGDAYLAVCGLPNADAEHAYKMVRAAMDIRQFMLERKTTYPEATFEIRLGIHSGPVVAGIVGIRKFAYDIWGDTVNTAARMEQSGEPGRINISETTYQLVKDRVNCSYRGEITAKNKGRLRMYFAESIPNSA